ncbi:MAG: hypothetical protein WCJ75_01460 [Desulfomonile sp.]
MKTAGHLLLILCVVLGAPLTAATQDMPSDSPPPSTSSKLDPQWKEFTAPPLIPGERPDAHRVQFGKQNCNDCHQKETPASYQAWLGSAHGINNIKCGVCHGDAVNYRSMPDKVVCLGCHSTQVKNMPVNALVTNCSFCHKGHWFTVHKIKQYEKFSTGRENRFNVPGF